MCLCYNSKKQCIVRGKTLVVPDGTKSIGYRDICGYICDDTVEEILLPETLENIEERAFFDLSEIKRINIPKSVTEIGAEAFWGLDGVRELVVPSSVERVGKYAFCNIYRCKLVIAGKRPPLPKGWDAEYAANVGEICFI